MKNVRNSNRIMLLCAFIVLVTASILSIFLQPTENTALPFPHITVPLANISCAILCLVLIFLKKEHYKLEVFLCFIQSFFTTITGYETIGAFLYSALIIILFINKFFVTHFYPKVFILLIIWILITLSLISISLERFILELSVSVFFCSFYLFIFDKLKSQLSVFLPATQDSISRVEMPPPGSKISLQDYDLSERQVLLLKEYLISQKSYGQLSNKFNINLSTIKRDMSIAFEKFGVKDIKSLHILLLQYEIE